MIEYRSLIFMGILALFCFMRFGNRNIIIRTIGKAGISNILMVVLNVIIPQYAVMLNGYTFGFAAIFGLPGVMTMYMLRMII